MAFKAGSVVGTVDLKTGEFQANITGAIGATDKMTSSMLGAQIQFALLERAVQAVTGAIKDSLGKWAKQEEVVAQTEARIKSTGGVAGLTAKDIQNLGAALQEQTTYADEDVIAMENLLLTFTNIRGDTFTGATEIILDMSTALGQDLKSSAIQVGKALQDPILGVTALRRVGVNLTEAQKDMITQLQRVGKVEEAQAIILKELQTEFGGAAKASKDTFGGAMKSIQNDIGDAEEAIGKALAPTIKEFVTGAIKPAVEWLKKIDEGTVKTVVAFGGMIVATYAVGKAITSVSNMLKAGITPLQGVLMAMAAVGAIVTVVNEAMARARTIHGELAEAYVKEYEAIDGQVSRYEELKNKAKLSLKEKNELVKVAGTLKQQLGEESAFIQDQSGKWIVNANSVQKYKKERLELAIKELSALKIVDEAEKKHALERQKAFDLIENLRKKGIRDMNLEISLAGRYQLDLLNWNKARLFSMQEVNKTTDNLANTTGQLDAITKGGVVALREYNKETDNNSTAKLQNTIVTDQMLEAERELAELRKENALEFMTDQEREIQALEDRLKIMREAGATETEVEEYYKKKIAQINEKYADKAAQAWQESVDKITEKISSITEPVSMAWSAIEGVWGQALQNEETALENEYERKKKRIEDSVVDEEERAIRLEELDAEYAEKRKELQEKQWVADKASKLSGAVMNTAQAVTAALTAGPFLGPVLAGIVGALGAVQIGLIAAEPMPEFKYGGDAEAGSMAIVGEEGREIVSFSRPAHVYSNEETEKMLGSGDFNINFYGDIRSDVDLMRQMQIADAQYRAKRRGAA